MWSARPLLRLPRVAGDDRGLAALADHERRSNLRMQAIRPRGLHQDVAAVRVPGLRDRAAPFALPAGAFARDEAEVRHALTRRRDAAPIHPLRRQHRRPVHRQAAEALQRRDGRRVRGRQREGRDHVTVVAPGLHVPLQHIARPARLVARADLPHLRVAFTDAPPLREVVRVLVDARWRGRGGEHGDRHRLLVNVKTELDDSGRQRRG